jgi:hypothetical protein
MKETRAAFALLFFIIAAHIAYFLPQVNVESEVSQSFSVTTCPGSVNGARTTALLPSKQVKVRELVRGKAEFTKPISGTALLSRGAIVAEGNPSNSWVIQTKASRWTSATTCNSGADSTWFVGGTANVTSQGKLVLINSGLSDATVEVISFSENGPSQPRSIAVKALTEREIRIDTLIPGADRLVVRVKVISGRVTSYLTDERVRGLNNIGGDFVSPIFQPSNELVIAGIPASFGATSQIDRTLRLMSTEDLDTTVSVEVISRAGVYVPVNLGNIEINAGEVVDVPLQNLDLGRGNFGLKITSDVPIVASLLSEVRSGSVSDFMWSAPSPIFEGVSFNIYGLEPTITLVGEQIRVRIQWRNREGETLAESLTGEEILNWRVPANTRLISISNLSGARMGMSWITQDGVTHMPIESAASLESAARPRADISVIQPRT